MGVFKFVSVIFILSLCLPISDLIYAQDSFRSEFILSYEYSEDDSDIDYDSAQYGGGGAFYFNPVNIENHPISEAAFLERVGSASLVFFDGTGNKNSERVSSWNAYGTFVNYMSPDSPFSFGLIYTKMDFEDESGFNLEADIDSYGVEAGYFIIRNLLLTAGYGYSETELSSVFGNRTIDSDTYEITAKYVKEMNGAAYNLECSAVKEIEEDMEEDEEENLIFKLGGDFYFNPRLSLGSELEVYSGDNKSAEGNTITVRGENYFTKNIAASLEYATFFAEDGNEGGDSKYVAAYLKIIL